MALIVFRQAEGSAVGMMDQLADAAQKATRVRTEGGYEELSDEYAHKVVGAVLTALRNPSDEVSERMSECAANGMVDWRDLHREMIDAVLEEKTRA